MLKQDYPNLHENSYHWAVSGMLQLGRIVRIGRNDYTLPDGDVKSAYHPVFSELAADVAARISGKFPLIRFTVFETVYMNDFLNHLIAQNTIIVQAEKDASVFVFRYLQKLGYKNLM